MDALAGAIDVKAEGCTGLRRPFAVLPLQTSRSLARSCAQPYAT